MGSVPRINHLLATVLPDYILLNYYIFLGSKLTTTFSLFNFVNFFPKKKKDNLFKKLIKIVVLIKQTM